MEVTKKQVEEIKITAAKGLDPITVYIDERKDEEYQGCCDADVRYKGRITILCYGLALNYFWGAMGSPMKEFFCTASTGYIADKFELNARETFKPQAYAGFYDENGEWQTVGAEVDIEMSEHHRKYICNIIEAVKAAFRELLREEK